LSQKVKKLASPKSGSRPSDELLLATNLITPAGAFMIKVNLLCDGRSYSTDALVDSGASVNVLSTAFMDKYSIPSSELNDHREIRLADGKCFSINSCLPSVSVSAANSPLEISEIVRGKSYLRGYLHIN
jgi:hypothetical protein